MLLGVLNNAGHAPIFALFAIVVLLLLRRKRTLHGVRGYGLALLIAVAAGASVELIQPLIGRGSEIRDLVMDTLGAVGGLALAAAWLTPGRRILASLVAVAAFAMACWPLGEALAAYRERSRQMPTVLDFGTAADWYFLRLRGLRLEKDASSRCPTASARNNGAVLRIVGGTFPGITHLEPQPDWSRYDSLRLDLTNLDPSPLPLTLRVHDAAHDKRKEDRFNREIVLPPATRAIVDVGLEDIAAGPERRRLDLTRVNGLILFARSDPEWVGRMFCVTRIWLE